MSAGRMKEMVVEVRRGTPHFASHPREGGVVSICILQTHAALGYFACPEMLLPP